MLKQWWAVCNIVSSFELQIYRTQGESIIINPDLSLTARNRSGSIFMLKTVIIKISG